MTRPDSEVLRELADSINATTDQRAALERVIPRLRAEEEQERQRRAEDDTQRLGPVRR